MKRIILVDESDKPQGFAGREECHRMPGKLHRAILVVLLDQKKGILLTRRVKDKLWGGIWDGTVATHVYRGETVEQAASRALLNELNLGNVTLEYKGNFLYKARWGRKGVEFEICHFFQGKTNDVPLHNPKEVITLRWENLKDLKGQLKDKGGEFTPWFLKALEKKLLA